ncbi:MAG: hypothetical protein ABI602_00950 [Candidatus Saccharibacteria bacterium]
MTEILRDEPAPKPTGVVLLELFEFEDQIGREINVMVGGVRKSILAEDFLDVCGEHAGPVVEALLAMEKDDPDYLDSYNVVREMTAHYLGIDLTQEN